MPAPRTTTAALALLVALVGAGCSTDTDPSPAVPVSPSASAAPTTESAPELPLPELASTDLAEVTTEPDPAWTSQGLRGDLGVTLVGGLARLGAGGSERVVDLRTGEALWSLREGAYFDRAAQASLSDGLVALDAPSGPLLVGSFYANRCAFGCPVAAAYDNEHKGLVALDARTGEVAWGRGLVGSSHAAFLKPRDRDRELAVRPADVGPQAVVAVVGDRDVVLDGEVDGGLPAYSVGLDPATGEQLWSTYGVVVDAVVDGMAVGHLNDQDDPRLVGLDPRTGEVVWRSTEASVGALSVSPRVVVLDDGSGGVRFVDTATGRLTTQQPPEGTSLCARWVDGDLDVACTWRDPGSGEERLLTMSAGLMSLSQAPVTMSPLEASGGVVVVDSLGGAPYAVVDAAGRVLLPATDQRVLALSERYVALGTPAGIGGGVRDVRVLRRR